MQWQNDMVWLQVWMWFRHPLTVRPPPTVQSARPQWW